MKTNNDSSVPDLGLTSYEVGLHKLLGSGTRESEKLLKRFWSKVDKTDRCWNWSAALNTYGYGQFTVFAKEVLSHRVSWILNGGSIPNGLWVLHRCDNPKCVNPNHLFLGTATDNNRDTVAKNRHNPNREAIARSNAGEKNKRAKLTWDKVDVIRHRFHGLGESVRKIAEDFGVSAGTISFITSGTTWKEKYRP